MKGSARLVGDVVSYPVDRVAARVTSRGPKWCTPVSDEGRIGEAVRPSEARLLEPRMTREQRLMWAEFLDEVGDHRKMIDLAKIGFARGLVGMGLESQHKEALSWLLERWPE